MRAISSCPMCKESTTAMLHHYNYPSSEDGTRHQRIKNARKNTGKGLVQTLSAHARCYLSPPPNFKFLARAQKGSGNDASLASGSVFRELKEGRVATRRISGVVSGARICEEEGKLSLQRVSFVFLRLFRSSPKHRSVVCIYSPLERKNVSLTYGRSK